LYIFALEKRKSSFETTRYFKRTLVVFNISLLLFWISLIGSGMAKAVAVKEHTMFYDMMQQLQPWFRMFSASGFVLTIAVMMLAFPLMRLFITSLVTKKETAPSTLQQETGSVRIITRHTKEEV